MKKSLLQRATGLFRRERPRPSKAQGVDGTAIYGGFLIDNEMNPALAGRERYRSFEDTMLNVSIVGAAVRSFMTLASSVKWNVEPANEPSQEAKAKKIAEAFDKAIHDMDTPWPRVTRKASLFRFYGASLQEWISRTRPHRDGWIGFRDVADRPMHTVEQWDVDDEGRLVGVVQRSPQDAMDHYIPRDKLVYCHDDSLTSAPNGVGLLRHVMEDVRRLNRYLQLEGFGFETDLKGVPVGRAPLSQLNALVARGDMTPEERTKRLNGIQGFLQRHIRNPELGLLLDSMTYQSQDAMATPSNIPLFDLKLLTTENSSSEAVHSAIERLTRQIARVMNAEWLILGGDGKGSLALSEDKILMFAKMIDGTNNEIAASMRADLARVFARINGWPEELAPRLTPDAVDVHGVEAATRALVDMATAGAVILPGDPVVNQIRQRLHLVEQPEELVDQARIAAEAKTTAEVAAAEAATAGARAMAEGVAMPPGEPGAATPKGDAATKPQPRSKQEKENAKDGKKGEPVMLSKRRGDAVSLVKSGKGVLIALHLPPEFVSSLELVMTDGSSGADLLETVKHGAHVTLAYLGKGLGEDAVEGVLRVAEEVARRHPPVLVRVGGVGRFSASETSEGLDPIYASIDSPSLFRLRAALVAALETIAPAREDHGFVPHMTLGYVEASSSRMPMRVARTEILVEDLVVSAGVERIAHRLEGGVK